MSFKYIAKLHVVKTQAKSARFIVDSSAQGKVVAKPGWDGRVYSSITCPVPRPVLPGASFPIGTREDYPPQPPPQHLLRRFRDRLGASTVGVNGTSSASLEAGF